MNFYTFKYGVSVNLDQVKTFDIAINRSRIIFDMGGSDSVEIPTDKDEVGDFLSFVVKQCNREEEVFGEIVLQLNKITAALKRIDKGVRI